jgi:hypothetical protein
MINKYFSAETYWKNAVSDFELTRVILEMAGGYHYLFVSNKIFLLKWDYNLSSTKLIASTCKYGGSPLIAVSTVWFDDHMLPL